MNESCSEDEESSESYFIKINLRLKSFMNLVQDGLNLFGRVPFTEFKLIDFPFDSDLSTKFFNCLGNRMRYLDIRTKIRKEFRDYELFSSFDGSLYNKIILELAPELERITLFPFPKLDFSNISNSAKVLTINLKRIQFKEWSSKSFIYSEDSLLRLFNCSNKLKELWIAIGARNGISILNILNALHSSQRYLTISHLHLAHVQISHLNLLNSMPKLRLNSLRIESFYGDFDNLKMFELFLLSQSSTLKSLYFRNFPTNLNSLEKLEFPFLPKLTKLDCETNVQCQTKFSCQEKCPELRILRIHGDFNESFDFANIFEESFDLKSLTTLYFRPGLIINRICLIKLAKAFPSVRNLTISIIDEATLRQLWISWSQLNHLEIHFARGIKNMDAALNGNSSEEDIKEDPAFLSLLSLSQLNSLHLEFNEFLKSDQRDDGKTEDEYFVEETLFLPSDRTAKNCLIQMKSLRRLIVKECNFSQECCKNLVQQLGLLSWTFTKDGDELIPSIQI